MTYPMKAYGRDSKGMMGSYIIQVCCEELSKTNLEYICKESKGWIAGGGGQHYYEMTFCPFCGEKLP